jgi:hypothetical protein
MFIVERLNSCKGQSMVFLGNYSIYVNLNFIDVLQNRELMNFFIFFLYHKLRVSYSTISMTLLINSNYCQFSPNYFVRAKTI